jgi:hypothetical protein
MIVAPEAVGALAFGAAFSAAGLATLGAGQLAMACAVGGALADAATQGVAIAFDDQHGFSVQSMVENAVAAGATAGLTKALGIQGLLTEEHPEYCTAFAESVGVGLTVQLFQLSIGLRDKLDIKFILEQAAATVLQAKINRGLSSAPKPLAHLVDEFENTGISAAFGQKPDLTALAGNYLGDEAGDTADLIANHVRQSHHTTSIGKSSKPSDYSAHAHARHADSHYMPDDAEQDGGIGDLYDAFKSRLQGDVNEMAQADFVSQLSASQRTSDDVQIRQTQRRVAKAGFFQRARHYLVEAREIAKGFENEARITGERILFSGLENSIHPLVTLGALGSSAIQDLNFLGTHLSQELMLAEANPLEYMQQSEPRMNTASFALTNKVRQFSEMSPSAMGGAGFDATLDAVSFLTPGVGEIKAVEVIEGGVRLYGRGAVASSAEMEFEIATGGRQLKTVNDSMRAEHEAIEYYKKIRSMNSDVDVNAIAQNTRMPKFRIQRIKQHLFFNTHKLFSGIDRFAPDIEIADAWTRLQNGNFFKQDIQLLHHEYYESRFEGIYKTDYITAHNAAEDTERKWNPEVLEEINDLSWRR